MISFKEFRDLIAEKTLSAYHKAAIARAHRGMEHDKKTKDKISNSMKGKANHAGHKHSKAARDRISHERGHYDPIGDKKWIVNMANKTYRRSHEAQGFQFKHRIWRATVKD